MEQLARWFRFDENGTTLARDTIAGVTTFIVMSYIIFVNPAILGFAGVEGLQEIGLPFDAVLTSTCLVAGVMTIVMGLFTNRAYAIAPGLGLNAFVAFTLVAGEGLGFPEAMGLVVVEGLAITILVLVGLRERIMNAIPLELKKAIAVGIGLFIGFIGLINAGLVVRGAGTPVDLAEFTTWPVFIALAGLVITIVLRARGIPGRPADRDRPDDRPRDPHQLGDRLRGLPARHSGTRAGRTTSSSRPTSGSSARSASTPSRRCRSSPRSPSSSR